MKNPVIIVTGAGKGIGRAIALEIAQETARNAAFKARLFLVSRSENDLKELALECEKLGLRDVATLAVDIADAQAPAKIHDACLTRFKSIDVLINNAGVGRFKDFKEITTDDFDYVSDINLKGTFFLTQKIYAHMEAQKSGHLIFVTSVAAETAFEQSSLYCLSKFGQKGLVEVLRLYGRKHGVRVTEIRPGAVYTPMWGEQDEKTQALMMKPEDIARSLMSAILLPERSSIEEIVVRPLRGDLA